MNKISAPLFPLIIICGFVLSAFEINAQQISAAVLRDSAATVTPMVAVKLGTSQPLSSFPENGDADPFNRTLFDEKHEREWESMKKRPPVVNKAALPRGSDPLTGALQTRGILPKINTAVTVEGINENDASGAIPPDPNGEISESRYIQMTNGGVNTLFSIFDRQGNNVKAPTSLSGFWKSFRVNGLGDPIVLYDQVAKRWLMSEISDSSLLAAVSATDDPLGVWHAYQFKTPNAVDFPKWGIWNNSYYVTTNEDGRLPVYLINRSQMLAGANIVDVQRVTLPKFFNQDIFQVAAPMDWDGATPPNANTPMAVLRIYDDAWDNTGRDRIEIWSISANWNDFTKTNVVSTFLNTTPFNSVLCTDHLFSCLAQPNGVSFDAGEGVLNNRVQYRNFGDHESAVLNFAVDITGNHRAGIRWYELRKSGTANWSIFQEGTFAPDTSLHRFMASIAMNGVGDIGLGYSAFGVNLKPSLYVTGRKAADPTGQMTAPETQIALGSSYNTEQRWGDYSDMTVDPLDDHTFWYTGEYLRTRSAWSTKITSFTVDYPTPTVDLSDGWGVHFFPNPATSTLNLRIAGNAAPDPMLYQIVNELGVAARSGLIEAPDAGAQQSLPLTGLPNGLYFLRLQQGAFSKTYKFIKQE